MVLRAITTSLWFLARAVRHGAMGAASGGVQAAEEVRGGALRRGVGGNMEQQKPEGGHQDVKAR